MTSPEETYIWILKHSDIQVGVPQPCSCLCQSRHGAQDNLSVQIVCDCGNILTLNGQLHIEQGQVEA